MEVIVVKDSKTKISYSNDKDAKKAEAKELLLMCRKENVPELTIQKMVRALWQAV